MGRPTLAARMRHAKCRTAHGRRYESAAEQNAVDAMAAWRGVRELLDAFQPNMLDEVLSVP